MKKPKDMTDEELLDQYTNTVRGWHYDPVGWWKKNGHLHYMIETLKLELLCRLTKPCTQCEDCNEEN